MFDIKIKIENCALQETYSMEAGSKRQMESSLIRLNFLLGRPSDIGLVQIDSEESAEVFQLR